MRRRALIMAVLLVAPLALLGGSRRPVFLLRPSPGLRKRVRVSSPCPPPRVRGGGTFVCVVRGWCSLFVPFSCPPRPVGRCGLVWLPQALRPGCRPLALSCSRRVENCPSAHRPPSPHRHDHIAAALGTPPMVDGLVGCVTGYKTPLQPTATARVCQQGKTLAALPPVQIDVQAPSRQSRNVNRILRLSPRADFPAFSHG